MNLLVSNIDTLFHFAINGYVRISYILIIGIGIIAFVLFILLTIIILKNSQQIRSIRKKLVAKQDQIEKLNTNHEQHLKMLHSQILELKKELKSATSKLERRNKRIELLNLSLSEKSDEINVLLNEKKSLEFALKKKEKSIKDSDNSLKSANESITKRNQELADVKSENCSLNQKLLTSQEVIASLNQELDTIKKFIKDSNPLERLANW